MDMQTGISQQSTLRFGVARKAAFSTQEKGSAYMDSPSKIYQPIYEAIRAYNDNFTHTNEDVNLEVLDEEGRTSRHGKVTLVVADDLPKDQVNTALNNANSFLQLQELDSDKDNPFQKLSKESMQALRELVRKAVLLGSPE